MKYQKQTLESPTLKVSELSNEASGYVLLTRLIRRGKELVLNDIHTERFDGKKGCEEIFLRLERKHDISSFPTTLKLHIIPD